jgi:4-alpha-glucanotransferase
MSDRHVGVNVPLFSLRSSDGWGIGEVGDMATFAAWLGDAGFDRLMLLPLGTMPWGQTSPYSAVSTLAIDPLYINLNAVPDFERAGGIAHLSPESRAAIDAARRSPVVRHDLVLRAKDEALASAFQAFVAHEWAQLTPRAGDLAAYIARERWWLDDYALFQAVSAAHGRRGWREWPEGLRDREPHALDEARRQLGRDVLQEQYRQWIAETQWQAARAAARCHGVEVIGDLPFVAATDSPEIWAHADQFRLDVSVGVPPDAFSPTGQDWGLPMYRWDVIRANGYGWLRQRARRMAALYDGVRADHAIGLYRTYGRSGDGEPFFSPADEPSQIAQGQAVLRILRESGLSLIAEDLGVVPDFLRPSLAALGVPGCRVFRWERDWHAPGAPFLEPSTFPAVSAAMTGTHDTEPLAAWWVSIGEDDRAAVLRLEGLSSFASNGPNQPWTPALRDSFLELAYRSGSNDLFLPVQDLFGWLDRVNVPGTVGPENWTWCLPWPVDQLRTSATGQGRALFLRRLARAAGRGQGPSAWQAPAD